MHMLSRKDLNSAERETVTTVITANGEVPTNELYVKVLVFFATMKLLENTPAVLSLVKPVTTSHKYGRRIQCNTENTVPIVVPGLSTVSSSSTTPTSPASLPQGSVVSPLRPAATRSESTSRQARRDPLPEPAEIENPNQNNNEAVLHDPLRDLPEWLQEFTHREPCGRKSSSTQGRTRELFS